MKPRKILLFDIDWTLMKGTGHIFREAHRQVFKKILGVELEKDFSITPHEGKTAIQFFLDIAKECNIPPDTIYKNLDDIEKFLTSFCEKHQDKLDFKILPHVQEALENLESLNYGLGIITGNFKSMAWFKLRFVSIDQFFHFGAYGNESADRTQLVYNAIADAEKLYKRKFEKKDIMEIGDNLRDVKCGKESGIVTVAVATGPVSKADLEKSGADLVLSSMAEWKKIAAV